MTIRNVPENFCYVVNENYENGGKTIEMTKVFTYPLITKITPSKTNPDYVTLYLTQNFSKTTIVSYHTTIEEMLSKNPILAFMMLEENATEYNAKYPYQTDGARYGTVSVLKSMANKFKEQQYISHPDYIFHLKVIKHDTPQYENHNLAKDGFYWTTELVTGYQPDEIRGEEEIVIANFRQVLTENTIKKVERN